MILSILIILSQPLMKGMSMDINTSAGDDIETATLGGGCFWCLEPIFQELKGVVEVDVGYAGGETTDPTYEEICTGLTGHAGVVNMTFHPNRITFREILDIFFTIHDPTTPNRQGADIGTQYRSIILYHNQAQKKTAETVIGELEASGVWDKAIVTEVSPFETFYKAETFHQEYYANNMNTPYCRLVIAPKVEKFMETWQNKR